MKTLARIRTGTKQTGLTLIEILVAGIIGVILTAGLIQLLISNKMTYKLMVSSSRVQENARFANEFLTNDLRMADFLGCYDAPASTITDNMLNDTANPGWDMNNVIIGYNDVAAGTIAGITNIVGGTDVIIIKGFSGGGVRLVAPYSTATQYTIDSSFKNSCQSNDTTNCEAEIYMVTDCSKATIFQATVIDDPGGGGDININHVAGGYTPGNASAAPVNDYGDGASLMRLAAYAYYIRLNAANAPSLYRSRLNIAGGNSIALSNAEEMVEGVENLQLEYGVDTLLNDGIPDLYTEAINVVNWEDVITVRFALLLSSNDKSTSEDAKTYDLSADTQNIGPFTDRNLRRVVTNTVGIRSRVQ